MSRGDDVSLREAIEARPAALETVVGMIPVHDLFDAQRLVARYGLGHGCVDDAQERERIADRAVGHVQRGGVVMLSAFERDRIAALRAHVLGGADAVPPIARVAAGSRGA